MGHYPGRPMPRRSPRSKPARWRERPRDVRPMLAELAETARHDRILGKADLVFEPKYDGMRALVDIQVAPLVVPHSARSGRESLLRRLPRCERTPPLLGAGCEGDVPPFEWRRKPDRLDEDDRREPAGGQDLCSCDGRCTSGVPNADDWTRDIDESRYNVSGDQIPQE